MKIFRIAKMKKTASGVQVRLTGTDSGFEMLDLTNLIKSKIDNSFNKSISPYMGVNLPPYVIFTVFTNEELTVSNVSLGLKIEALILPNFPKDFYPWLVNFIQKELSSHGITVLDIRHGELEFEKEDSSTSSFPKYEFVAKMGNEAIKRLESKENIAYLFPNENVFKYTLVLLGAGSVDITSTSLLVKTDYLEKNLLKFKNDAEKHGLTLEEFLISEDVLDHCSASLQNFIKTNYIQVAHYLNKLESLLNTAKSLQFPFLKVKFMIF